ncbi:hypothetical protein BN77_p11573 [Rhizobium mesoamericanum STM3625]|uniref:Uncharacterized protein n=1 Tax=Rhizobium mesoamericanum STM3625 TaxID=1211777 RepID=K0PY66_9HYPH|nr:hypothetical protein BN77_p11573 [Rhizobium mesoamericanum STM3625]
MGKQFQEKVDSLFLTVEEVHSLLAGVSHTRGTVIEAAGNDLDMAAIAYASQLPSGATEEVARMNALDCQTLGRFGIRVDIERVNRAVELAHEARLASIQARSEN